MAAKRDEPSRLACGWKRIIILFVLLITLLFSNALALHDVMKNNDIDCSHLPPNAIAKETNIMNSSNGSQQHHLQKHMKHADRPSNMTFIGISSHADRVSDSAILFLVEAACVHNIKSYILLGEKNPDKSLKKKIEAMIYHWHLPLPYIEDRLDCINLIRVRTAPVQEELLNMTRTYIESNDRELTSPKCNNPLDPTNRIAMIKRSREYQRQQLLQNKISWGSHYWDCQHDTVIGVLDLDLFAYPLSLPDVIEIASQHIIPSTDEGDGAAKFHAICANGLQISNGRRSYYDIFSTILLPNTWLQRISDRVTAGENSIDMAKMSQTQILQWFLKEGGGNNSHLGASPVPVRSCFNGLTLYRADIFLDVRCRYDLYDEKDALYCSKSERHTCEHIVFNECLRRVLEKNGDNFRIAVKTDLLTLWHLIN